MTPISRRGLSFIAAALLVSSLGACGSDDAGDDNADSRARQPADTSTKSLPAANCASPAPVGKILRSGYGLTYSRGTMNISVTPAGSPERCVQFRKSGPRDPNVPPDTMLFTFAGDRGEGSQLEFLAVDLAGGVLPWPVGARARNPGAPITSTIGISLGGEYFTSNTCALTLTSANAAMTAGRFTCPAALAQTANPLDPNDDVPYDDPQVPAPQPQATTIAGWFSVTK